ncbi:MAG: ATP-binding cassette domain-containing protein [Firmicutes bacterium]|jgi:ABC-2 type transport system ATP-binding protein|nr:ATP-binding cassette domain-containing protein [Bacillota bacterium]
MLIEVAELKKTYIHYERGGSFLEAVKSIFHRKAIAVEALKGISFTIEPGELVGFLGPNGAGKSTTIKILTGVLYPSSGRVQIAGYVPWRDRMKYVAGIGAVFGQKSQLIWDIPPVDAFLMNKAIYRIPDKEYRATLDMLVSLLEVERHIKTPTRQLSLGERMRCEFIMAMLHRPQIVFLDEPTIGLDVVAKEKIRNFIKKMNEQGVTFILTTHDLDDVERLARRVILINRGEIVFDDTLEALRGYLGKKKFVTVRTAKPLSTAAFPGMEILNAFSEYQMEMELDTETVELNAFIRYLDEKYEIKDLTVEEPPIEDILKSLY